jgi:hypothetical protein
MKIVAGGLVGQTIGFCRLSLIRCGRPARCGCQQRDSLQKAMFCPTEPAEVRL